MTRKLNVLWATDGSRYSLDGTEMIRSMVMPVASKVHVLTMVPDARAGGVLQGESLRKGRAASLERGLAAAETCRAELSSSRQVEPHTQVGHPVQGILRAAQKV
jgi:hypothetical protein